MSNSLIRVSRRAMACEFEVCFPAGKCENGTEFALESLDLVESLEDRLSYFRPESEISRINRLAAETPVEVEPALFDLLRLAMRLFEETGGAYDITSAPLWEAWGFARRAGEIPSEAQLAEARSCVGGQLVELNPAERTIRFRKPGVKINVGSIGKGYALDVCAERLLALGMTDFLLHGGQSSVLARGSQTAGDAVASCHCFAEAVPVPQTRCPALLARQAVAQPIDATRLGTVLGGRTMPILASPGGGLRLSGSTIGPWARREGSFSRFATRDAVTATFSIRDRAGRPKACFR